MVAFATDYEPGTATVEPKNRVGNFFVDVPGCIGIDGPQTRTGTGENDRFSYDACQGVSLAQGGQTPGGRWVTDADGQESYEMNPYLVVAEDQTLGQRMISQAGTGILVGGITTQFDSPAPGPMDLVGGLIIIGSSAYGAAAVTVRGVEVVTEFYKGRSQGKGERNLTSRPDGTRNPWKHMKPHPTKPDKVIYKDPHTGKSVIKPKPPGFPGG